METNNTKRMEYTGIEFSINDLASNLISSLQEAKEKLVNLGCEENGIKINYLYATREQAHRYSDGDFELVELSLSGLRDETIEENKIRLNEEKRIKKMTEIDASNIEKEKQRKEKELFLELQKKYG